MGIGCCSGARFSAVVELLRCSLELRSRPLGDDARMEPGSAVSVSESESITIFTLLRLALGEGTPLSKDWKDPRRPSLLSVDFLLRVRWNVEAEALSSGSEMEMETFLTSLAARITLYRSKRCYYYCEISKERRCELRDNYLTSIPQVTQHILPQSYHSLHNSTNSSHN